MTPAYYETLLAPFRDSIKSRGDAYVYAHFSKLTDQFRGDWYGIDEFDAMILIKQLVKDFKIDPIILNTAL